MRRYVHAPSVFLLLFCASFTQAQSAPDPKQAKVFYTKSLSEPSDQAQQVRDLCKAAELDPKNKDYGNACSQQRQALVASDRRSLDKAKEFYSNSNNGKAEEFAGYVTTFDPTMSSQARELIRKIKTPVVATKADAPKPADNSSAFYAQTKAAWERGAFDEARRAAAQDITDPTAKDAAGAIIAKIDDYTSAMEKARALEQSDPQQAKDLYASAFRLNPKGPGDPSSRMTGLQAAIDARNRPAPVQANTPLPVVVANNIPSQHPAQKPVVVDKAAEDAARVKSLLAEGQRFESAHRLDKAFSDYEAILVIQRDNGEAMAARDRVKDQISKDPKELDNMLLSAVRNFYDSRFGDAKVALDFYLGKSQSRAGLGAAHFYLGATLLERAILETPKQKRPETPTEVLKDFQDAKKEGYKPVRGYVSPALLRVWDSTGL